MKQLFRILVLFGFIFLPFYCSLDNPTDNYSQRDNSKQNLADNDPLPCCNNRYYGDICGNPFDPNALVSFKCDGVEYTINCNCCRALWVRYGSDPYGGLNYDGPPCPGDLHFLCNSLPNFIP